MHLTQNVIRRPTYGKGRLAAAACLASLLFLVIPDRGRAEDAAAGEALARLWCAECHLVEPGKAGSDVAKPFGVMAEEPGFSRDKLQRALMAPHPPMPNINPSRDEIDDLYTYIESLRGK